MNVAPHHSQEQFLGGGARTRRLGALEEGAVGVREGEVAVEAEGWPECDMGEGYINGRGGGFWGGGKG